MSPKFRPHSYIAYNMLKCASIVFALAAVGLAQQAQVNTVLALIIKTSTHLCTLGMATMWWYWLE